jgi:hypothetical protein
VTSESVPIPGPALSHASLCPVRRPEVMLFGTYGILGSVNRAM